MTSNHGKSNLPSLPVINRNPVPVLTVGPQSQLAMFDRRIVEFSAKHKIGQFILAQEHKGRFERPSVNADGLGRLILKRARKQLAHSPKLMSNAIKAAGTEILEFYTAPVFRPQVFRSFCGFVDRLNS